MQTSTRSIFRTQFNSLNRFSQTICASHFKLFFDWFSDFVRSFKLEARSKATRSRSMRVFQLICVEFFSSFLFRFHHFTPWMKLSNDFAAFSERNFRPFGFFIVSKQKMHTPIVISWRWFRRLNKNIQLDNFVYFVLSLFLCASQYAWNLIIEKEN